MTSNMNNLEAKDLGGASEATYHAAVTADNIQKEIQNLIRVTNEATSGSTAVPDGAITDPAELQAVLEAIGDGKIMDPNKLGELLGKLKDYFDKNPDDPAKASFDKIASAICNAFGDYPGETHGTLNLDQLISVLTTGDGLVDPNAALPAGNEALVDAWIHKGMATMNNSPELKTAIGDALAETIADKLGNVNMSVQYQGDGKIFFSDLNLTIDVGSAALSMATSELMTVLQNVLSADTKMIKQYLDNIRQVNQGV